MEELQTRFAAPSTAWIVDGRGARPVHGELPDFAMRPLAKPLSLAAPDGDRDAVVREYLRSMREVVEQQRQIMLAYLGGETPKPVALPEAIGSPAPETRAKRPPPPERVAPTTNGSALVPLEADDVQPLSLRGLHQDFVERSAARLRSRLRKHQQHGPRLQPQEHVGCRRRVT
jgi:hypothetical protein